MNYYIPYLTHLATQMNTKVTIGALEVDMNIEQVGELCVIKARYDNIFFSAVEQSVRRAKRTIAEAIAIYSLILAFGK